MNMTWLETIVAFSIGNLFYAQEQFLPKKPYTDGKY